MTRLAATALAAILGLLGGLLMATPAFAAEAAHLQGVVTAPDGGVPDAPVRVVLSTWAGDVQTTTTDLPTGHYALDTEAGAYYLRFEYLGDANILPRIYADGSYPDGIIGRGAVTLSAGANVVDRQLRAGATVTGTATGTGGVIPESLTVTATVVFDYGRTDYDPVTGLYVLDRLPPGMSQIRFRSTARWSPTSITLASPTVAGETRTGQDVVLTQTTTIEGRLSYREAPPGVVPAGVWVKLWVSGGWIPTQVKSEADGSFHFYGVAPGSYRVCVNGLGRVFENCWDDVPPSGNVPYVKVTAGQILSGIDIPLDPSGVLEGRVLARMTPAATPAPLGSGRVTAYRLTADSYVYETHVNTQPDGTYVLGPLPPGDYAIRFSDDEGAFGSEYWEDERYFADGTDIAVAVGSTTTLADVVLDARTIDVGRIGGTDRFEVGVNVSRALYPSGTVPVEGVPVVYVANGLNFPDALTASPAAALQHGVVLLVGPTSIPPSVAAELSRLRPQRIVVAGGPASVSPGVLAQLATYVDDPADVVRAGGVDRYDASRTIVRDAFEAGGADVAIITTGANFPDALAAGPAAASQGAPVILVDGSKASIDAETRQLLQDLGVQRVYIAGGTGSVAPGIESSLDTLLGADHVVRFAGADRFAVGVMIAQQFFSLSDHAYVATGFTFPDALTGGPLAAAYGAPLYLSGPSCLPNAVGYDMLDLDVQDVVLLGGPASLSPAVENLQLCG